MCIYIYIYTHTYILYTYIEREMCVCVYIYIHTHIHIYIYIYNILNRYDLAPVCRYDLAPNPLQPLPAPAKRRGWRNTVGSPQGPKNKLFDNKHIRCH